MLSTRGPSLHAAAVAARAPALAAPALGTADDRSKIAISEFFLLQLPHYNLNMLETDEAGVTSEDPKPSVSR